MCIAFSINYLKTFEILNENPRIGPLISVWACFKENYKYVQLYRYEKKYNVTFYKQMPVFHFFKWYNRANPMMNYFTHT